MRAKHRALASRARRALAISGPVLGLLLARTARAGDVCIELDLQRDTLSEADRELARDALAKSLEHNGQTIVPLPCNANYRVYNSTQLDGTITIVLSGPRDSRTLDIASMAELPKAYEQLIKSLLDESAEADQGPASWKGVAREQLAPRQALIASGWVARLGYGGLLADRFRDGPALGFGYRYQHEQLGVDVSFMDVVMPEITHRAGNFSGTLARVGLLYAPFESVYGIAALGYAKTSHEFRRTFYGGSGLAAELAFGYVLQRTSSHAYFAQLDGAIPSYSLHPRGTGLAERYYALTLSLTFGVSIGGSKHVAKPD